MKSVKNYTRYSRTIKKSEFITHLIPCNHLEDIEHLINKYSKNDASHNCKAYIIGTHEKADDDGEPSGTAGLPMLNVLKRQELTNILVIVTRYFGGIKLGAGGLTRAYTNSVADALKKAEIVEKELVKLYQINTDYHFSKKIEHMIHTANLPLLSISYDTQVHYQIYLKNPSFLDQIKDLTSNQYNYKIIGEDYIEKY